jgi:uncharacterized protein (TIGR02996 family)
LATDVGLIIEVADSSPLRDQRDKTRIYARGSIPIYWIVNLVDRRVEVYSQPSGPAAVPAYGAFQLYQPGGTIPLVLDGYRRRRGRRGRPITLSRHARREAPGTTMTYEEGFVQAICEAPDDDTPRLISADWLEENGQPERAEFIRVQCRLGRMDEGDPGRPALLQREQALLRKNRARWRKALPEHARKADYLRGFPAPKLRERCGDFLQRPADGLGPFPLWHITLTRVARDNLAGKLAGCPLRRRAMSLSLVKNALSDQARALLRTPHLVNVESLCLHRNWIGRGGVRALAEAALPRLRDLDLGGNQIDDAAMPALAGAPVLGQLRSLGLHFNQCRSAGAQALAASPYLGNLERLEMAMNYPLTDVGKEALRERFGARVGRL